MQLLKLFLFALTCSYGEARGIGLEPTAHSLNDGIGHEDGKIEEINDAEASVEVVEEVEKEILQPSEEDELEKAKRLIPILMRLQKKYPSLGKDEQVEVLRKASGYKEDFKDALNKLEASPDIIHGLDIPYLRQIFGVVRLRKPKKSNKTPLDESQTNDTNKEGEDALDGVLANESIGDIIYSNSEIVTEGLFAIDYDPNSKIANEGLFADDIIDPNSKIVTEGLFAGNVTGSDDEEFEDLARAASYIPFSDQDRLPLIPPPVLQLQPTTWPTFHPFENENFEDLLTDYDNKNFDDLLYARAASYIPFSNQDTNDPFNTFDEVQINLNFAAPFPTTKQKFRQPTAPLNPLMRYFPYPSPLVRPPYAFLPPFPRGIQPTTHHRMRRSIAPASSHPNHYNRHTPYHSHSYPRRQMYHPYWDTSYQQSSRYQPLRYGQYNPYVFDYQTSASLDDPLLTAHYPSSYYGYSMQPLPSLRPNNPFSSMQSPGLSLNPHYQYSRAAYRNFLHQSMDGVDPVQYVKGLTGV